MKCKLSISGIWIFFNLNLLWCRLSWIISMSTDRRHSWLSFTEIVFIFNLVVFYFKFELYYWCYFNYFWMIKSILFLNILVYIINNFIWHATILCTSKNTINYLDINYIIVFIFFKMCISIRNRINEWSTICLKYDVRKIIM